MKNYIYIINQNLNKTFKKIKYKLHAMNYSMEHKLTCIRARTLLLKDDIHVALILNNCFPVLIFFKN